jgi:uncharacterized protein (DUF1330 family)
MAGYIIAELEVTDPEKFEEYRKLVPETIAAYGGKYVVRGGTLETLEGEWNPKRLVILEFESCERAKAWLNSEEYAPARKMRWESANTNVIVVEGL